MPAGRPTKPTQLKAVQGTLRPSRVNPSEPKPEPAVPTCPSWLPKEAKAEWRRIVPQLERLGLLTLIDRAALAAYCQSYARWEEAERFLAAHSLSVELTRTERDG